MSEIRIIPFENVHEKEVLLLLDKVFQPWMGDGKYFHWKYKALEIPECQFPRAWVAMGGEKVIAFNGYIPRPIQLGGELRWIAQSFDTATDPDCRGQGLFWKLNSTAYEVMKNNGVSWIYGWASSQGADAIIRKAGWTDWGIQKYLMRIVNPSRFLKEKIAAPFVRTLTAAAFSLHGRTLRPRMPQGFTIKEEIKFPDTVSALWKTCEGTFRIATVRDCKYLNWRISRPGSHYRLLCIYQDVSLRGYIVLSTSEEGILEIEDCASSSKEAMEGLLSATNDIAENDNTFLIRFRVNNLHPWMRWFQRVGYFWSRSSLPMYLKLLNNKSEDVRYISEFSKMHWTLFDRNE